MAQTARIAVEDDRILDAVHIFRSMRRIDPVHMDGLEYFGHALRMTGDEAELNKLAHDVLAIDDQKSTGWLIVALFCELRGDVDKALCFIDKVSPCVIYANNCTTVSKNIILTCASFLCGRLHSWNLRTFPIIEFEGNCYFERVSTTNLSLRFPSLIRSGVNLLVTLVIFFRSVCSSTFIRYTIYKIA